MFSRAVHIGKKYICKQYWKEKKELESSHICIVHKSPMRCFDRKDVTSPISLNLTNVLTSEPKLTAMREIFNSEHVAIHLVFHMAAQHSLLLRPFRLIWLLCVGGCLGSETQECLEFAFRVRADILYIVKSYPQYTELKIQCPEPTQTKNYKKTFLSIFVKNFERCLVTLSL
jgi:hypothetical protein